MSTVPVATLVFSAMELSNMYLAYAGRAKTMTVEEANAAWDDLVISVKASGASLDAAVAAWKERHPED